MKYRIVRRGGYFIVQKKDSGFAGWLYGWHAGMGYYIYGTLEEAKAAIDRMEARRKDAVVYEWPQESK